MKNRFFKNIGNVENNTAGVVANQTGPVIQFKRLAGGKNIVITETINKITIASENNSNDNNDGANILNFTEEKTSSPYIASAGEFVLINIEDFGSGEFIVNLPPGSTLSGDEQIGVKISTSVSGNYITLKPDGTDLIDNTGSIHLTSNYESVIVQYSFNGKWWRIG